MQYRADLAEAQHTAWEQIGAAGTWWTGAERVAIAAETRHALACPLCARAKDAISRHGRAAITRHWARCPAPRWRLSIASARSRPYRRSWYRRLMAEGMDPARYAELLSVVAVTIATDTFRPGRAGGSAIASAARRQRRGDSRPAG